MLPVELDPSNPLTPGSGPGVPVGTALGRQQVLVKLCLPTGKPTPATVQVLVHGITYDHRYWNIADPADPQGDRYSWEAAAAKAGYATVAIDRIGAGASTHPPSTLVTMRRGFVPLGPGGRGPIGAFPAAVAGAVIIFAVNRDGRGRVGARWRRPRRARRSSVTRAFCGG
jgi:hypothetical protein